MNLCQGESPHDHTPIGSPFFYVFFYLFECRFGFLTKKCIMNCFVFFKCQWEHCQKFTKLRNLRLEEFLAVLIMFLWKLNIQGWTEYKMLYPVFNPPPLQPKRIIVETSNLAQRVTMGIVLTLPGRFLINPPKLRYGGEGGSALGGQKS